MALLRQLRSSRGRKYRALRSRASQYRKRLIAQNKKHVTDDLPKAKFDVRALAKKMPPEYRARLEKVLRLPGGRQALKRYRAFTGLPFPPEIKVIERPGPRNKVEVLVGMGKSPEVQIADGDEKTKTKIKRLKGTRIAATSADGKRIFILSGRNSKASKAELKLKGRVPQTHYVLTRDEEDAGTFKKNRYWVHEHNDEGGKWPQVYQDQAGNFIYGPGTYSVGKWIRR